MNVKRLMMYQAKRTNRLPGMIGQVMYAEPLDELQDEVDGLRADIEQARRLIERGVALMTPDQVGQWEGVRHWLETAGGTPIALEGADLSRAVANGGEE